MSVLLICLPLDEQCLLHWDREEDLEGSNSMLCIVPDCHAEEGAEPERKALVLPPNTFPKVSMNSGQWQKGRDCKLNLLSLWWTLLMPWMSTMSSEWLASDTEEVWASDQSNPPWFSSCLCVHLGGNPLGRPRTQCCSWRETHQGQQILVSNGK